METPDVHTYEILGKSEMSREKKNQHANLSPIAVTMQTAIFLPINVTISQEFAIFIFHATGIMISFSANGPGDKEEAHLLWSLLHDRRRGSSSTCRTRGYNNNNNNEQPYSSVMMSWWYRGDGQASLSLSFSFTDEKIRVLRRWCQESRDDGVCKPWTDRQERKKGCPSHPVCCVMGTCVLTVKHYTRTWTSYISVLQVTLVTMISARSVETTIPSSSQPNTIYRVGGNKHVRQLLTNARQV